ncbi:MAG TPA: MFS transporter [Candidatus Binataceae bacterium]|nr:MFS transporter [Candidatus Binataceae bacterium]
MSPEQKNLAEQGAAALAGAPFDRSDAQDGGGASVLRGITRRYYAMWWGYAFAGGFLYGIYPLFLRSRGLDQFEINSVLACYFVVMFLTDVPTGAFADAMGRRRSFVLGCATRTAAFAVYFFAHRFAVFVVAECIDGIGTTLCNGAIDAWGVDALDAAGFAGIKDRLFSRISQLMNFGFMAAAIIGAYVADIDIAAPWLLGAAGFILAGAAAFPLMREDHRAGHGAAALIGGSAQITPGRLFAVVLARVAAGLRQGLRDRTVLMLSSASALTFAAWAPYWLEWPQIFNDRYGVGIWIVGWLYCLFTVARMLGAEAVARIGVSSRDRGARLSAIVAVASPLLFVGGAMAERPTIALVSLFVMNLAAGAMQPLTQSWFNERIDAADRATLLSFNSTFATMGGSLGLLAAGRVADVFGIPMAWKMGALILMMAAPCYWTVRHAGAMLEPAPAIS